MCTVLVFCFQVRALELEKELESERSRLAELRKLHYHLAGSEEGWEVDEVRCREMWECGALSDIFINFVVLVSGGTFVVHTAVTHTCMALYICMYVCLTNL